MKLQETINKPLENGIFKLLKDKFSWLTEENVLSLNMSYYFGHSGEKEITPLYENLLENYTKEEALEYMSNIVYVTYNKSWNKIYQALEEEYNPIHNYNMTENEESDSTSNGSVSSKGSSTENSNTYGFNSSSSKPTDTQMSEATTTQDSNTTGSGSRKLTRSGNIGVTTSQKMLREELEVRKTIFFNNIMSDVDNLLCLCIY